MTTDSPGENTYVLDAESPAEMARLISLDRITTKAMGGPLAGLPDPSSFHTMLDIACGPGGWVLDTAFDHPESEVTGVDISKIMIDYANARARTQNLLNASFSIMDITQPLDFPDNTFDLVNARFLAGVLRREAWKPFLAECTRILRPGGILRLTEPIDTGTSNSPAIERLQALGRQMLWRSGYTFSVDGFAYGMTHMLPRLLRDTGYHNIEHRAHALEFSAGTEGWIDVYQNWLVLLEMGKDFYVKTGLVTQEEVEQLYQHVLIEMQSNTFCGMWHFMSIWGQKPQE